MSLYSSILFLMSFNLLNTIEFLVVTSSRKLPSIGLEGHLSGAIGDLTELTTL